MAQIENGIRGLLARPRAYDLLGWVLGAGRFYEQYLSRHVQPGKQMKMLDIGCGTGSIIEHLPESMAYTGFDINPRYIEQARQKYGSRGRFVCERVSAFQAQLDNSYDLALATAVLHHLGDEEAHDLFRIAVRALKPGGRLVTLDCAYIENQSKLARFVVSKDRGLHIRTPQEYSALAEQHFDSVELCIEHDMLRIPYTHCIMKCSGGTT